MVDVPAAPVLGRVANVELMHTGTWPLSTGEATFSVEDLQAAVAALDCPSVRRPILKFGHTPDPAQGQPAAGFIDNMATAENGRTLVGDYVGMPGWLVDTDEDGVSVLSAAYPDRSIEGAFDFRCQLGHTHPFVVTAVALLGEEMPAIGTIESLQDLGARYGVAAAAEPPDRVAVTIRSTQGDVMPNPQPLQVAASVTTEDVRRAFYASPMGAGWSKWIEEMQLDPPQLIIVDDEAGSRARVPVTVGEGDGQEAVAFGEAVPVTIRYDDATTTTNASLTFNGDPVKGRRVLWASRTESRPAPTPAQAAAQIAAASKKSPAPGAAPTTKGAGMDPAKLREGLGLGPDASDDEVKAALADAGLTAAVTEPPAPAAEEEPAVPVAAAAPPAKPGGGTLTVDASAWDEQQKRIKRLEAADVKRRREERDKVIAEAIQDGKFLPNRKDHWARAWDGDPEGTRELIASLHKNVIPVEAMGFGVDDSDAGIDEEFAHLFPPVHEKKGA